MNARYDVCVFGLGPAGVATAVRLADLGLTPLVLERPAARKPWGGESFTGAIRGPLATLGLWRRFCAAGHVAGFEQRSAWGEAGVADSIFHPYGQSWHVDRDRFDADLRTAVAERGIAIRRYARLDELRRDHSAGTWHVGYDGGSVIAAPYLVDATGRAAALGRRLGVRPQLHDRLVALTALVPRNPAFDHAMAIATTAAGWWYAAPVPQGHVLAFFTDSDLVPQRLAQRMRTVPASSAFTTTRGRDGWLAVGDACAAHDPLCGWGVHRALANGIRAADAIARYLRGGNATALDDYDRHCGDQFDAYLAGLAEHYAFETRFAASPFWQRRLSKPAAAAREFEAVH